jgi:hypothetical protein
MKRILVQCVPSLLLVLLFNCGMLSAEPVPVRHREGTAHGFLLVRTLEGTAIAPGDLVQVPHGDQITSRLAFNFEDGSIDDETTVYSQRVVFRLISDHHVQKGPLIPQSYRHVDRWFYRKSCGPFHRRQRWGARHDRPFRLSDGSANGGR